MPSFAFLKIGNGCVVVVIIVPDVALHHAVCVGEILLPGISVSSVVGLVRCIFSRVIYRSSFSIFAESFRFHWVESLIWLL